MKIKTVFFYFLIINTILFLELLAKEGTGQKISVIIVGHGAPASDFPKLKEYFKLHDTHTIEAEQIENELRNWPRNEKNDPYWVGFLKVIDEFKKKYKNFYSVYYAFNEMCAPTIEEALLNAYRDKPDLIIVTSIMFTPGGVHSEKDIPAAIEMFIEEHPDVKVVYAWPYSQEAIAELIYTQLIKFISN